MKKVHYILAILVVIIIGALFVSGSGYAAVSGKKGTSTTPTIAPTPTSSSPSPSPTPTSSPHRVIRFDFVGENVGGAEFNPYNLQFRPPGNTTWQDGSFGIYNAQYWSVRNNVKEYDITTEPNYASNTDPNWIYKNATPQVDQRAAKYYALLTAAEKTYLQSLALTIPTVFQAGIGGGGAGISYNAALEGLSVYRAGGADQEAFIYLEIDLTAQAVTKFFTYQGIGTDVYYSKNFGYGSGHSTYWTGISNNLNAVGDGVNTYVVFADRCPLVLDLDKNGRLDVAKYRWTSHVPIFYKETARYFAIEGDGSKDLTEWFTPNPKDGLLVIPDENGRVESVFELFGLAGGYSDGYEKLSLMFDKDENGWVEGAELDKLAIWVDKNTDAICQDSELHKLSEYDIKRISVKHTGDFVGKYETSDGNYSKMWDWWPTSMELIRKCK